MNYENWNIEELSDYIKNNGFEIESKLFLKAKINGNIIHLLTEEHLKEIGITLVGPRLNIYQLLKNLQKKNFNNNQNLINSKQTLPNLKNNFENFNEEEKKPIKSSIQNLNIEEEKKQIKKPVQNFINEEEKNSKISIKKPLQSLNNKTLPRPTTALPLNTSNDQEEIPKYKREHEKMVQSIRAARKYMKYQKDLEQGKAVGPPPELAPFEEPEGLVQCPTCGRKMGEEAAKHHFPVCSTNIFSKTNSKK